MTVPAAVLRTANLRPGDPVSFEVTADGAVVVRGPGFRESSAGIQSWVVSGLVSEADGPMSTDEFLSWLDEMAGVPAALRRDPPA